MAEGFQVYFRSESCDLNTAARERSRNSASLLAASGLESRMRGRDQSSSSNPWAEWRNWFWSMSPASAIYLRCAELKRLRALHVENLRRVSDFSGLAGLDSLRYLAIHGTLD